MRGSETVHVDASPELVWDLVADVTNTGRFSPETFEAEWIDGATGPSVGARFRGHVRRNGRNWLQYWTKCTVVACEPGREFTFVVGTPERWVNKWSYRFAPADGGTDVTESFELADNAGSRLYWKLAGSRRGRTNHEGMRATLERLRMAAETEAGSGTRRPDSNG